MAKTSFTVHLDTATAEKIEQMKEQNPTFSRNALIRLAIAEYRLHKGSLDDEDSMVTDMSVAEMKHLILFAQSQINRLHKDIHPDWKRKKSLPYHFPHEYNDVANYTEFHGQ